MVCEVTSGLTLDSLSDVVRCFTMYTYDGFVVYVVRRVMHCTSSEGMSLYGTSSKPGM